MMMTAWRAPESARGDASAKPPMPRGHRFIFLRLMNRFVPQWERMSLKWESAFHSCVTSLRLIAADNCS